MCIRDRGRKDYICGYQDILYILLYLAVWAGYMRASTVPSGQKNGKTEASSMDPVSYTHLDVYKRQEDYKLGR